MEDELAILFSKQKRFAHLYQNKNILAPMVRVNKLPFRLLALENGADLVYSEELIDYKLSTCTRVENDDLGTIDFVDKSSDLVFQTCAQERDHVIVQLGSNDPDRALKTAQLLQNDIAGIDFNFGCPKSFSLKGGMGAALLEKPDLIEKILKNCVYNLDIPVTCKIRVFKSLDKTLDLVKRIEECGVAAIAVHGRTKDERNIDLNRVDTIKAIVDTVKIPVIANGSSFEGHSWCNKDSIRLKLETGASSVMVGRDMRRCPSLFIEEEYRNSTDSLIKRYIKLSQRYRSKLCNVKYVIPSMHESKYDSSSSKEAREVTQRIHSAKSMADICSIFDLQDWYNNIITDT